MKIGFHVSIQGGYVNALDRAAERGIQTIQIFSSSPRAWFERPVGALEASRFIAQKKQLKISPVVVHTSYLVNFASSDMLMWEKSVEALKLCFMNAVLLEADYVVTHIGHIEKGYKDLGRESVALAINELFENFGESKVKLLLENSAGAGSSIGHDFKELGRIFEMVRFDQNLGICLDTCHAYAAGYDIATAAGLEQTLNEIEKYVGSNKIFVLHANDSKGRLGSKLDRHQNIGEGEIGLEGFRIIANHLKLKELPFIMETPRMKIDDDLKNLEVIKSLIKSGS